jgi:hypothetical protein
VIDRLADGRVVHVEDVVEQERRALEGGQPLEREQQRDRQIIGEAFGGLGDDRLGQPRADVFLAPVAGRLHAIEAEPRHDAREVGAWLRDRRAVDVAPAQECVLDDVFGLGDRAEHAIREARQELPMRLEVRHVLGRSGHAASLA